jgi:hypothetical protein
VKKLLLGITYGVLTLAALSANAQVPQVLGVWELNIAASNLPERLFPQGLISERRSYFQRDDGYLSVLAIRVNGNGVPDFIQVVAKSDGQDYPQYQSQPLADFLVNGTTSPFTYSETIVDANTAEIIAKRAGQVTNKGTRTISADGRTMTLNVAAVLPGGEEIPIVLMFDKQGE